MSSATQVLSSRWCSAARVANSLDVVAVRVADEGAIVARVVLRPQARLMQDLRARRDRGSEELIDRRPAHSGKRDMRLPEPLTRGSGPDPEFWPRRNAEADDGSELLYPAAAQGAEHSVVESSTGRGIGALNRNVIDHILIVPDCCA